MIASALFALLPLSPAPTNLEATQIFSFTRLSALAQEEGPDEYETRLAEAGEDAELLWALHKWCKEQGKIMQARECLKKIVAVDPDHKDARKSLGHHFYDDQWFESYFALTDYKSKEEKRMLEEEGLVRFGDSWVPKEDEPYLRLGMVREEESGEWVTKRELDRRAREAKYIADGWTKLRDMTWASPEELPKSQAGFFKVGEEWLDEEAANAHHSTIGQWWTIRSDRNLFEIWSTCPFQTTRWAGWHADRTYNDLVRAYGTRPDPDKPPVVLVLRTKAQYNTFAAGEQARQLAPTESQGFSSIHYAYFAESWILQAQPPEYMGTGVALWDTESDMVDKWNFPDPFGQHAVRHAAALAFAESIDPSLETIGGMASAQGQGNFPFQAFWGEKKIPIWFRVGVSAYCERYYNDAEYSPDNQWVIRDWSLDNIRRKGGPMPFDQIFAMQLNPNDIPGSQMRINQAGMLLSFILDGDCKPVVKAHRALTDALREGADTAAADMALRKAIEENEEEFHIYVRM